MNNEIEDNQRTNLLLITLALVISALSTTISLLISGLLLIDIGNTFNVTVAVAGQLRTFSSIIAILFAFLTTALTLRYNHKTLLQIGLIAYILSATGCCLAPNLVLMIASFSLTGIGYALTTTMAFTLVAELFPVEKRGETIGMIIGGMSGSYLIGAFIVPYLQNVGGWRLTFSGYMLPTSLLALILSSLFIPRKIKNITNEAQHSLKDGFRNILSNKSACLSLVGLLLAIASGSAVNTYAASFFRQGFYMTVNEVALLLFVGSTLYTVGSIMGGRIVNRTGSKPLTVVTILFSGLAVMSFAYIPSAWISGACLCISFLLFGMMDTSSTSLIIEQIPVYAGVMMSLSRVAVQFGFSVGAGLGGMFLLRYSYNHMFLILGTFSIASAFVFNYFTIEPLSSS
jgi:DHA1 family putative efflux transporter-like MFS transporter